MGPQRSFDTSVLVFVWLFWPGRHAGAGSCALFWRLACVLTVGVEHARMLPPWQLGENERASFIFSSSGGPLRKRCLLFLLHGYTEVRLQVECNHLSTLTWEVDFFWATTLARFQVRQRRPEPGGRLVPCCSHNFRAGFEG